MKTIKLHELSENPQHLETIARTLKDGGLVCVPCRGTYRILADFNDQSAVTGLMQSKRRTKKAPSLVFVKDSSQLKDIVDDVDPIAQKLADTLWPGPLTILFKPNPDLPRKVTKQVAKANGYIGIRIPQDDMLLSILDAFGGPVLVSSANKEKKSGETSPAQVRKNFVSRVDIFVDAGDLQGNPASTVIEINDGSWTITRQGEITEENLTDAVA